MEGCLEEWGASGKEKGGSGGLLASWSPPPTPPVPSSPPPLCGLATSGSNYQPGSPDLIGTFQISEGEGEA